MAERKNEQREDRAERESLKEREYRDKEGNVHHHTRTYMEQHKGEKRGGGEDSERKESERSTREQD